MRLLLDAMFSDKIASQLRERGHDVVAAAERPDLADMLDAPLFAAAQAERRAVVTENVGDFMRLDRLYRHQGRAHHGLIFTSDRRFPRSRAAIGRLVRALDTLLRTQPPEPGATGLVHWLE